MRLMLLGLLTAVIALGQTVNHACAVSIMAVDKPAYASMAPPPAFNTMVLVACLPAPNVGTYRIRVIPEAGSTLVPHVVEVSVVPSPNPIWQYFTLIQLPTSWGVAAGATVSVSQVTESNTLPATVAR